MSAVGDLLPVALAVALSPVPIIAIIVVLGTARARTNGPAFSVGWVAGLTSVIAVVLLITDGVDDSDGTSDTVVDVVRVAVGGAFLVMAVRAWQGRPRPGEAAPVPGWVATLDEVSPGRAAALGVLLSAANPKNLALTSAAAATITDAGLETTETVLVAAIYVAIGSVFVVGATLSQVLGGDRATRPLAATKEFMLQNNAVITMVVLVLVGASILGDGLSGLAG
jgi:threonine/homoserine/homoserine lactone efflux protein